MIVEWMLEGEQVGQTELSEELLAMIHLWPASIAAFCHHCGRVWAGMRVPGKKFHPRYLPCEHCPAILNDEVPGSLWFNWDRSFTEALPDRLIEREFALHLAFYDKEIINEAQTGDTGPRVQAYA